MPVAELALHRAFPALSSVLPRFPLLEGATPVEIIDLPGFGGTRPLYVKRDERSCSLYGGNKPRKLEWLIGRARQLGCKRLVTSGGLGTHHGLATTILGRAAGLRTSLVLVDQPLAEDVRRSLRLHAAWGADLVYGRNVLGGVLQSARVLTASALRGERPYLIWTGGSSARGTIGFVSAGLELAEQVRAGLLPEPEEVWLGVGSGGTIAGLGLGLKLAGLATRVRGVLANDIVPPSPRSLARLARASLRLLRRADPSVPALTLRPADFPLDLSQVGAGYGSPTEAGEAAREIAAERGLVLESTYTAKGLAGLFAQARKDALPAGPILFWNTFNAIDAESAAPIAPRSAQLPAVFRRLLQSE